MRFVMKLDWRILEALQVKIYTHPKDGARSVVRSQISVNKLKCKGKTWMGELSDKRGGESRENRGRKSEDWWRM